MNNPPQIQSDDPHAHTRWAVRILALALAGIASLTLYPFRFAFAHQLAAATSSPFLLRGTGKDATVRDAFLNVLLFVPFGFGLAGLWQRRWRSRLAFALLMGAAVSYTVELLQFFIPERDSGWGDVLTNASGSLLGCLIYLTCGIALLRPVEALEGLAQHFASPRNVAFILIPFFALSFAFSAGLQRTAVGLPWHDDSVLVVGNSAYATSAHLWKGSVTDLEFWDRALPDSVARAATSSARLGPGVPDPLAAFQFTAAPPFVDDFHLLPDLAWTPRQAGLAPSLALWAGDSWVSGTGPATPLIAKIRSANRFTVRVRCSPSQTLDGLGHIVSLSQPGGGPDMEMWQDGTTLGFWFRNRYATQIRRLIWRIPDVFTSTQPRNLLFSFDGADLSLHIDGRPVKPTYRIEAATSFGALFRLPRTAELQADRYEFYSVIFFPAGLLLGLAWRKMTGIAWRRTIILFPAVFLPSLLLELILFYTGERPFSLENLCLGAVAACGGALWINLGGSATNKPAPANFAR